VADYPEELRYVEWKADCLYLLAYDRYTDQETFYTDLEKAGKLYQLVWEHSEEPERKQSAAASLVMTLAALRRYGEAKEYAEAYPDNPVPDKQTVMGWALTGEEKEEHRRQQILSHLDSLLNLLIECPDPDNANLKRMENLQTARQLIALMIPDDSIPRYNDDLLTIHVYMAQIQQYSDQDQESSGQ